MTNLITNIIISFQTFPDPEHCSKYWDCYNGIATHMTCRSNYLYDPKTQWCDFPEKVYCGERNCDGRPCKQNPDPVCDFDCKYDGFFAYPENCAKYVICRNGKPNCHMCRTRKIFRLFWLFSEINQNKLSSRKWTAIDV